MSPFDREHAYNYLFACSSTLYRFRELYIKVFGYAVWVTSLEIHQYVWRDEVLAVLTEIRLVTDMQTDNTEPYHITRGRSAVPQKTGTFC